MRIIITLIALLNASTATADEITIRIINEQYREVWAFSQIEFDGILKRDVEYEGEMLRAQQFGGGISMMSSRLSEFQTRVRLDLRQVVLPDNNGKFAFMGWQIGGQYYPRKPTFRLGALATRLTFGGLGGGTVYLGEFLFLANLEFNAGLSFTSGNEVSAIYLMGIYRPLDEAISKTIIPQPGWSLRAGLQFAPGS